MDLVLFVFLYTTCIGGCGYVFMTGEPDEPGFVNFLNRCLTQYTVGAIARPITNAASEGSHSLR